MLFHLGCAFAPNVQVLITFRFLGGMIFILPVRLALLIQFLTKLAYQGVRLSLVVQARLVTSFLSAIELLQWQSIALGPS